MLLRFCACSVLRHCGADSSWPALSDALLCLMPGGGEVWGRIKSAGVGHSLWTFPFSEDISIHAQKKATGSQSTSLASCRKLWQGLKLRQSFGGFKRQRSFPLRQGTGFWINVRNISLELHSQVNGTRFSVVFFFIKHYSLGQIAHISNFSEICLGLCPCTAVSAIKWNSRLLGRHPPLWVGSYQVKFMDIRDSKSP